jgi:hypothetical protein
MSYSDASTPYLLSDIGRHWFAEVIGEGWIFPTLREGLDAVRPEGAPILSARDYCCGKRELF